jgi:integrase
VDLLENFDGYMRMDVAASSQRTYDMGVRRFLRFCQRLQAPLLPEPTLVSVFVIECARANYALSTIRGSITAIQRWAADDYGMPDIGHQPCVVRALKVASWLAVLCKRQKLPLSKVQLLRVLAFLARDPTFINVRDAALFQVGWAGMFRSSELVGLHWEHVYLPERGGVMLYVPQSKTDPGEGAWVRLAAGEGFSGPCYCQCAAASAGAVWWVVCGWSCVPI